MIVLETSRLQISKHLMVLTDGKLHLSIKKIKLMKTFQIQNKQITSYLA